MNWITRMKNAIWATDADLTADGRKGKSLMQFTGKWLADSNAYRSKCLEIAAQLRRGENPPFKQDPVYCKYVGNDNRSEAITKAFAEAINSKYHHLLPICPNHPNDSIGSPKLYEIHYEMVSPGTLRFVKVMGDIKPFIESGIRIIEIGAGYGGQCKVIRDFYRKEVIYTLIDIPESLELSSAYLKRLGVDGVQFISCEEPIPVQEYDLCISDYCLGELDDAGIAFYVENVIKNCKNGYFTVHESVVSRVTGPLSKYFDLKVQYEEPQTHVVHKNFIIKAVRK